MVPVRKFSMRTSAPATRRLSASTPSGCLRSSAMSRLLRLMTRNAADSPSLWGGHVRDSSPLPVSSTLMTSAPRSESSMAQKGPASTREQSTTRMPSRARAGWVMTPKITELLDPDHLEVDARGGDALPIVGGDERESPTSLIGDNERRCDMESVQRPDAHVEHHVLGAGEHRWQHFYHLPLNPVIAEAVEDRANGWLGDLAGLPSTRQHRCCLDAGDRGTHRSEPAQDFAGAQGPRLVDITLHEHTRVEIRRGGGH